MFGKPTIGGRVLCGPGGNSSFTRLSFACFGTICAIRGTLTGTGSRGNLGHITQFLGRKPYTSYDNAQLDTITQTPRIHKLGLTRTNTVALSTTTS